MGPEPTARPAPEPGLASSGKVTGSKSSGIEAVNDLYEPEASNDQSIPRYHWWPKKGTSFLLALDFF
ncbi:MAG: hypothetical protein GQ544_00410 [Candidatus Aminicenantes bacterium]|nr:hypothetical protein [Candidatus Aminicenantes bacterium]